jgi:hypothetical protein
MTSDKQSTMRSILQYIAFMKCSTVWVPYCALNNCRGDHHVVTGAYNMAATQPTWHNTGSYNVAVTPMWRNTGSGSRPGERDHLHVSVLIYIAWTYAMSHSHKGPWGGLDLLRCPMCIRVLQPAWRLAGKRYQRAFSTTM